MGANAHPFFLEEEMDATTFKKPIPQKPFDVNEIDDKIDEGISEALSGALSKTSLKRPAEERNLPGGITKALLTDRQTTHGSFEENAKISQGLKEWMRNSPGWAKLTDVEREAMDMIALKFSRVLSGKSLEKQHWEDIVGYGQLALNLCV